MFQVLRRSKNDIPPSSSDDTSCVSSTLPAPLRSLPMRRCPSQEADEAPRSDQGKVLKQPSETAARAHHPHKKHHKSKPSPPAAMSTTNRCPDFSPCGDFTIASLFHPQNVWSHPPPGAKVYGRLPPAAAPPAKELRASFHMKHHPHCGRGDSISGKSKKNLLDRSTSSPVTASDPSSAHELSADSSPERRLSGRLSHSVATTAASSVSSVDDFDFFYSESEDESNEDHDNLEDDEFRIAPALYSSTRRSSSASVTSLVYTPSAPPTTMEELLESLRKAIAALEQTRNEKEKLVDRSTQFLTARIMAGNKIGVVVAMKQVLKHKACKEQTQLAIWQLRNLLKDAPTVGNGEASMIAKVHDKMQSILMGSSSALPQTELEKRLQGLCSTSTIWDQQRIVMELALKHLESYEGVRQSASKRSEPAPVKASSPTPVQAAKGTDIANECKEEIPKQDAVAAEEQEPRNAAAKPPQGEEMSRVQKPIAPAPSDRTPDEPEAREETEPQDETTASGQRLHAVPPHPLVGQGGTTAAAGTRPTDEPSLLISTDLWLQKSKDSIDKQQRGTSRPSVVRSRIRNDDHLRFL